jgi:hypothetical protein
MIVSTLRSIASCAACGRPIMRPNREECRHGIRRREHDQRLRPPRRNAHRRAERGVERHRAAEGMADKGVERPVMPPGRVDRLDALAEMQMPARRCAMSRQIEQNDIDAGIVQRIRQRQQMRRARVPAMHQKRLLPAGASACRRNHVATVPLAVCSMTGLICLPACRPHRRVPRCAPRDARKHAKGHVGRGLRPAIAGPPINPFANGFARATSP